MKKIFKKLLNALTYLFLPRKMGKIVHMSTFFGFMILLCCLIFSFSSSNMTVENYVTDNLGDRYFLDFVNNEFTPVGEKVTLPEFTFLEDAQGKYTYAVCNNYPKDGNGNNIYEYDQVFKDKNDKTINVKYVYELEYLETVVDDKEEVKISNEFTGTYTFISDEVQYVLDVVKNGKGYINGEELSCSESGNTLTCTSDKYDVTISYEGANYSIKFKFNEKEVVLNNVTRTVNTATLKHFDLNSYMLAKDKYDETETDVLIIFTRNLIYYLYNRGFTVDGYNFITLPDKDGNYEHEIYTYYLPADILEYQSGNWTKSATRGETTTIEGVSETITAKPVVTSSLNELFAYNVPVVSYNYCKASNIPSIIGNDPYEILKGYSEYHVSSWGDSVAFQTGCRSAIPFGFLVPMLCVLVTFLVSKRNGNMKTFKEYFNLAALVYIPISIVEFIVGFFVQYSLFAYFAMAVYLAYYIIAAYRINTEKQETQVYTQNNTTLSVETPVEKVIDSTTDEDEQPNLIG